MEALREFLDSPKGKVAAGLLVLAGLLAIYYSVRNNLGPSEAARMSSERFMVCAETNQSFKITVKPGLEFPCKSPYSGRNTGYPAELCYWTRDGQIKQSPTCVLLNSVINKPGPTFCPECGRLVVPRNPPPVAGKAPPTEEEYRRNRPSRE